MPITLKLNPQIGRMSRIAGFANSLLYPLAPKRIGIEIERLAAKSEISITFDRGVGVVGNFGARGINNPLYSVLMPRAGVENMTIPAGTSAENIEMLFRAVTTRDPLAAKKMLEKQMPGTEVYGTTAMRSGSRMGCGMFMLLPIATVSIILAGCGTGTETSPVSPYPPLAQEGQPPKATDNLIFAKGSVTGKPTYDSYAGLPGFPIGRYDARWLGKAPGFEYVNGHMGGTGDTLEVISKDYGMYFYWSYSRLGHIDLTNGWQGQIETENKNLTGIRIGSPIDQFLLKFPDAVKSAQPAAYGGYYWTVKIKEYNYPNSNSLNFYLHVDTDVSGTIKELTVL